GCHLSKTRGGFRLPKNWWVVHVFPKDGGGFPVSLKNVVGVSLFPKRLSGVLTLPLRAEVRSSVSIKELSGVSAFPKEVEGSIQVHSKG
ncbi:hypothetical protein, partial [Ligilactobacillus salivarius]